MSISLTLPDSSGRLVACEPSGSPIPAPAAPPRFDRVAFSAAHVVADPLTTREPGGGPAIDWPATLAFRRHLLALGFGVAEAMDTAQRGMGLDWPTALDLIGRTLAETSDIEGARIFSGAGTDQLAPADTTDLDSVIRAWLEQVEAIQKLGGRVILMASRALARVARGPADYVTAYGRVLEACEEPVILHWLGEMFDPALAGYWGAAGFDAALETCLEIIGAHAAKVDGIKLSLLDDSYEVRMRRRLPRGVRMYTGDDFNYPDLIEGDEAGHSDALLGIFDAIAPAASAALTRLAAGDVPGYRALLQPTVPLSRLIFRAPTRHYKTGIVFLAYLNGMQDHFVMLGGAQAMRPLPYFCDIFRLADRAGLLSDPDLAAARMARLLALYGIEG